MTIAATIVIAWAAFVVGLIAGLTLARNPFSTKD